jgi:exodeoxyribonuclease VII large subunit
MRRYTVTSLTKELTDVLERRYPSLLVEGELAQVQVPGSGHAYMILRDARARGRGAQLACVCWASTWRSLRYKPKPGDKVVCRGRLGVYGDRGVYQLYVNHIEAAGAGDLAQEIARRIARLQADGLLDPGRKRELPAFPSVIGVATSATGAALQDFLKVSRRRHPATRVLVAPCLVQGEFAAASVIQAVDLLLEDGRAQVIVVTRGGGSKEDLLPFQDEQLARFLAASPVPVVSAVGHQVDTTISDLVADKVAATPSEAAELVLPDGRAMRQRVDETALALQASVERTLQRRQLALDALRDRLRHPAEKVALQQRRVAELRERAEGAVQRTLRVQNQRLTATRAHLQALSPLAVLGRGYAIVQQGDAVVTSPEQVAEGDTLAVRVEGGPFEVTVRGPRRPPR